MKYIRVHDKRTKIDYPWMADIRSLNDLLEIEQKFSSRNAKCIMDYLQSKDYSHLVNKLYNGANIDNAGRDHCKPNNVLVPFLHACALTFPEKEVVYPLVHFTEKLSLATQAKVKCLMEYKRILITINGGFMTWGSNLEELESTISNRFPQYNIKEVKISKWPEGRHFYATINDTSIVVDGVGKWNTEKMAYEAVEKWLGVKKSPRSSAE